MINEKEIKYLEKIKQLEEENKLLKQRILSNILNDNTEIVRLNITISNLQLEIENLRKKYWLLKLGIR